MVYSFFDEDSVDVAFCCNEMGVLSANLNKNNLDDNFDENPQLVSHKYHYYSYQTWHRKFKRGKALEKELNKELMHAA